MTHEKIYLAVGSGLLAGLIYFFEKKHQATLAAQADASAQMDLSSGNYFQQPTLLPIDNSASGAAAAGVDTSTPAPVAISLPTVPVFSSSGSSGGSTVPIATPTQPVTTSLPAPTPIISNGPSGIFAQPVSVAVTGTTRTSSTGGAAPLPVNPAPVVSPTNNHTTPTRSTTGGPVRAINAY